MRKLPDDSVSSDVGRERRLATHRESRRARAESGKEKPKEGREENPDDAETRKTRLQLHGLLCNVAREAHQNTQRELAAMKGTPFQENLLPLLNLFLNSVESSFPQPLILWQNWSWRIFSPPSRAAPETSRGPDRERQGRRFVL